MKPAKQQLEEHCSNSSKVSGYLLVITQRMLPQAVHNYGFIELYLTGLACNIHDFSQLLIHQYFEVLEDYKDIGNLLKGKKEVTTNRLMTFLLKL